MPEQADRTDGDIADVLVVGAGPGGSNAAATARARGLDVIQVDARKFPRIKPCAGGLTEKAIASLHVTLAPSVRSSFRAFEFVLWDGDGARFVSDRRLLTMVHRPDFDNRLVAENRRAGITVYDGEPLREVSYRGGVFHARTTERTIHARQLIGADGAYSFVDRTYDIARPAGRAVAVEVTLSREVARITSEPSVRFDFGVLPRGYGWIFPKDDHWSVGLYTLQMGLRDLRERLARYIAACGFRVEGDPLATFEAHQLPVGGFRLRTPEIPVYLIGDAAGLADALTGEGIYYALESGRLAGECAAEVAAGRSEHSAYYRRLRRRVCPDTWLTWHAARWFYDQPARGLRVLGWHPVWRTFVHGYGRGATFTECVLKGAFYAARSFLGTGDRRAEVRSQGASR